MFEGFVDERVDVGDVALRVRHGGEGPPVLLVHGHPRTGATWHRVAPLLVAAGHTVVCPDMRGYGRSDKPELRDDHSQQSKKAWSCVPDSIMTCPRLLIPLGRMLNAVMPNSCAPVAALHTKPRE